MRRMTNFTKSQVKALEWGFKADGALRAPGARMGGAYRRCCERLVDQGLLGETPPMGITIKGLVALRGVLERRFADNGHMANMTELQAVEAALAEFPHSAARFTH
jgi:hypothetical protein